MVNSAELLATAYNNMPDACLLVVRHRQGEKFVYTVQSVNQALCQLAALPEQEVLGKGIHELVAPPLYWKLLQQGEQVAATGKALSSEYRVAMSGGNCVFSVEVIPCSELGEPCSTMLVIVRDTTSIRQKMARLRAALRESKRERAMMEQQHFAFMQVMTEVQEEEHKRIASALHEDFAQVISAAMMNFSSLDIIVGKSVREQEHQLEYAVEVMKALLHDVKALAYDLMPMALYTFGLVAALEDLFLAKESVVSATFALHTYGYKRLIWVVEVTLYRIIREIISTMYTCYDTADISVQLVMHQQRLSIVIDDNGQCALAQKMQETGEDHPEHVMRGVIARVQLLNGSLNIDSHEQSGTVIAIDIPLHDSFFVDELDVEEVRTQ